MTHRILLIGIQLLSFVCADTLWVTLSHNLMGNLHLCQSSFYLSARPLKYLLCHVTNPFNYPACICVCVLTDISRALRDGQIGASTPRSALVIPLTAATVRPSGVVFTLAAQLLFVIHTAVGMKVALAPVRKRGRVGVKRGQPRCHEWNFPVLQWKKQLLLRWTMWLKGSMSLTSCVLEHSQKQLFLQKLVQRRKAIQWTNLASLSPTPPPHPPSLGMVAQF